MYASKKGNTKIVKLLLKNCAYIDNRDKYNKTSLIYAIEDDNKEIIKILNRRW